MDAASLLELRNLLGLVEDTHEVVLPAPLREGDELFVMWSAARAESNLAYDGWRLRPGARSYTAYRAAEDRADAAQDALHVAAERSGNPPRPLAA